MLIGVVSDSHGMSLARLAQAAANLKLEGIQRLVHLGDGARDADALADYCAVPLWAVAGNCDGSSERELESIRTVGGVKVLICHGHKLSVKLSELRLKLRAEEVGAGVALYGHTHFQDAEWDGSVLLLNPGALCDGRYALLSIADGDIRYELRQMSF